MIWNIGQPVTNSDSNEFATGDFEMRKLLTAAAILLASTAFAEDTSTVKIENPVIVKAFENARAAGGYMMIQNTGEEADLLIEVKIEGRMAMIHESREDNGVMRMLHVDAVEVPAESQVSFAPGGFHVMVMGLQPGELPVGETVGAILVFDRAGEVPVTFVVTDKDKVAAGGHMGNKVTN